MSTILGLHYGHNGTACILRDGKLIVALSSERLTRSKFSHGLDDALLDYVFAAAGMTIDDIDAIALSDWAPQFANHDIEVKLENEPAECLWNTIFGNDVYQLDVKLRGKRLKAYHIAHHLGHAAAAYYTSPFDESFAFTMDASGGKHKSNCIVAYGKGDRFAALYCPNLMIGVAYGFFTEYLGIGPQVLKAGSTMALAAYGEPLQRVLDNLQYYVDGCFFPDEKEYRQWYPDLWKIFSGSETHYTPAQSDSKMAQNIAATMQLLFEESVLKCIGQIEAHGCENLCMSGGSMLNCVANSRVLLESQFSDVFLFPGCGDDGCCVGTAFYLAHHVMGEPRVKHEPQDVCFLGPDRPCVEPDYGMLAEEIANGKIVAWCNGRSEFGPRALGNRSLLGDPRNPNTRERINFQIKMREWYRPLAPTVMEEHVSQWFDFPAASPFMLFTGAIKDPGLIPAVNHIDNSARIQTVNERENPSYYRLIKAFYELTGVPILVNTSLNTNGEPLVETDDHALALFNRSPVDLLVLNGKVYRKEP